MDGCDCNDSLLLLSEQFLLQVLRALCWSLRIRLDTLLHGSTRFLPRSTARATGQRRSDDNGGTARDGRGCHHRALRNRASSTPRIDLLDLRSGLLLFLLLVRGGVLLGLVLV